jgi:hypothetical protein
VPGQCHPFLDHMPTQFGINQTVFHFLDRRQQSLVTQPLPPLLPIFGTTCF